MRNIDLAFKGLHHRLHARGETPLPFVLGFSVTERYNSGCKTCKIWMKRTQGKELEVYEWERLLAQIGHHIGFYTFSGGEPFMRSDLPELLSLPFKYGNPRFLTLPTNGLLP